MEIKILRLPHGVGLPLPVRMTQGSSGFDITAAVETPVTINPGERAIIPTGFCYEIPVGSEVQIRPRSGLAAKFGVTVLNTPGTIDADYRGEIKVILINLGKEPFIVNRGERVAQAVPALVDTAYYFGESEVLTETNRGAGGFGHTGR